MDTGRYAFENCQGLASSSDSFPKVCKRCQLQFDSLADFIAKTGSLVEAAKSSLTEFGMDEATRVGVWRNCKCGTTLVVLCRDRRDTSRTGLERRQRFDALLKEKLAAGTPPDQARQELLNQFRREHPEAGED